MLCVRKKEDCVFLRRIRRLASVLQPLAGRLRPFALLRTTRCEERAVVISLSNITPQRCAIINNTLIAPVDHLEHPGHQSWARKVGVCELLVLRLRMLRLQTKLPKLTPSLHGWTETP